jgi:hypothetical protein
VVTVPDPEDHDRRKDAARHGSSDDPADNTAGHPDDSTHNTADNSAAASTSPRKSTPPGADAAATDAAFASIIADFREDPDLPQWPADQDRAHDSRLHPPLAPGPAPAGGERRSEVVDDDHYQPPEPPPLPVPRPRTVGGVLLLALGVLLLVRPSLLTLNDSMGTPLGLLALTAGIGWLVLGLRSGPPSEGWDDGARL